MRISRPSLTTLKVKCDETRDECGNCRRLNFVCTWEDGRATSRSRSTRACARCRQKKLRCLVSEQSHFCHQCEKAGEPCNFPQRCNGHAGASSRSARLPDNHVQSSLPQGHYRDSLIDAYFACPHYFCFLTFIHRPSFTKMLQNDLIPRPLLLIVLATGLRQVDPSSPFPSAWADECRKSVVQDIFARISTMSLQTLLLLQQFEWHRGSHLSAWFLAALATRLAHALQLNLDPEDRRGDDSVSLPISVIETRRRLIWSCFAMESVPDVHHGGSRPLHAAIDPQAILTKLPGDEYSYERGLSVRSEYFSEALDAQPPMPSLSAYLIRMADIRLQIIQLAKAVKVFGLKIQDSRLPWEDNSSFSHLQQKLEVFSSCISTTLPFMQEDPSPPIPNPNISFFTLHIMFHAAYTDLFRIGTHLPRPEVPSMTPPPEFLSRCRAGAIEHALTLVSLISQAFDTITTEVDPFVSICSCLAIRTLVVERWDGEIGLVGLQDPSLQSSLEKVVQCAKRTALWSVPIRKLVSLLEGLELVTLTKSSKLFAVAELTAKHGYSLDVDDLKR